MNELGNIAQGFKTALNQTGDTAMRVVGATGLDRLPGWQQSQQQTQDIANRPLDTPAAKAGAAIENIIEFAAGDEALKGASMLTKINELKPFAEALKKSPVLTRIMGNAVRNAAVSGGQTAAHGGDLGDVAMSTATGGLLSGAMEGVPAGWTAGREALNEMRPTALNIAGADFPTLAKTGKLNLPALTEAAIDPASAAVDEATANLGQRGVIRSLGRTNAARAVEREPMITPSRALPPPQGSTPGFPIQTGEPTPTGEGSMALSARKKQIGTRAVAGKGPGEPYNASSFAYGDAEPLPQVSDLGDQPEGSHREPINQYLTSPRPSEAGNVVTDTPMGGGGVQILTSDNRVSSVAKARSQLAQYERILDDPETVGEMGVRQHQQLIDAHADLSEQLRRFDDYAASQPHFPMPDVQDAVANTNDLGTAGQQLMDAHRPFWQRADELSNGDFTALDRQRKGLIKAIRSDSSTASRFDKIDDLQDVNDKMDALFDKHRANFSPEEWQTAKSGYKDGATLQELHNIFDTGFKGITKEDQAVRPGKLQRVFKPGDSMTSKLESFYQRRGPELERTIGPDGMRDLKQISQLFQTSERRAATQGLLQSVGSAIRRHGWAVGGLAGMAAYGPEHAFGSAATALGAGTLGGGTVSGTLHYLSDKLTTNPEFAKRFIYAAKNNVSPRIAGPLLADTLIRGASSQMIPDRKKEQQ
jgi:hypothetical protein